MRAAEVTARTGITYRQLDYWCRRGILPDQKPEGPGSGRDRDFTDDDVAVIENIQSLARGLEELGISSPRGRRMRPIGVADRVLALNELLASGMSRTKAVEFLERWLPLKQEVA